METQVVIVVSNSIGDQSTTIVEVESGSSSSTITTVADKSTFNGNIRHRLTAI